MGLGQILSYATRRIKLNQIRIRKRELDASNNRSFASEFVSSDYEVTGLVKILFTIISVQCALDLFTNDVILAFDDALRWNKCRMDIEIELTKGIFFLEVVFPSTKAHFDLTHPS